MFFGTGIRAAELPKKRKALIRSLRCRIYPFFTSMEMGRLVKSGSEFVVRHFFQAIHLR